MGQICHVGPLRIGKGNPLALIAGPCTLESIELGRQTAAALRDICHRHKLPLVFKASFDKANRTSVDSPRGPGIGRGLEWLAAIRDEFNLPVTTDIHDPSQAETVAAAVDLLQIPAFLCRQTDLLLAAGRAAAANNRAVNVKKGQHLSPREMTGPAEKLASAGCRNTLLTERGTFFGYNRLVNDFQGLAEMMNLDLPGGPPPVCFDCTHSTQRPGEGRVSGGSWNAAPVLARAAAAVGVHAIFVECHPDPARAVSDAASMVPLSEMDGFVRTIAAIRAAID